MRQSTCRHFVLLSLCLLSLGCLGVGCDGPAPERVAVEPDPVAPVVLPTFRGQPDYTLTIPERIHSPLVRKLIDRGTYKYSVYYDTFRLRGSIDQAEAIIKTLSPDDWTQLIPNHATVSVTGSYRKDFCGTCPFCGKRAKPIYMSFDDFLKHPYRGRMRCCGAMVYAREADRPDDYPVKPNRTVQIPHLDGTMVDYAFYVPEGPEDRRRRNWFSSPGEVWAARAKVIMRTAIPALASAVYFDGNTEAERHLVAIFDRLADIYPSLPLYDGEVAHGFARGPDKFSYMTREQYLSEKRPRLLGKPFWYENYGNWWRQFNKIWVGRGGAQDDAMDQAGLLAQVYELVRDGDVARAYSQEKYDDPEAFNRKVMTGLFKELDLMCKAVPDSKHNWQWTWIRGAYKLGILLKDPWYLEQSLEIMRRYVVNDHYSDGLSCEGAFNYGAMMEPIVRNLWMMEQLTGRNPAVELPFMYRVKEQTSRPIITLYNIESMHGDQHSGYFTSKNYYLSSVMQPPAPDAIDYGAHERSQVFPEHGLACLRGGEPGRRMELIMDWQSGYNHEHRARLNVQLFYEGMDLLPDIGYCRPIEDISRPPFDKLKDKYPFPMIPTPVKKNMDSAWRDVYSEQTPAHFVGTVDGRTHIKRISRFVTFTGGGAMGRPDYSMQFVEAEADQAFWNQKLGGPDARYRRQVAVLTLPGGAPVAVDVVRLQGGQRHELYWHTAATETDPGVDDVKPTDYTSLDELTREEHPDEHINDALKFITDVKRAELPGGVRRSRWLIDPAPFRPITEEGRHLHRAWQALLHPVELVMFSRPLGTEPTRQELLLGQGPWPAKLTETADKLYTSHTLCFDKALDYTVERRLFDRVDPRTEFVTILAPHNPDQPVPVTTAQVMPGSQPGAVVVKLVTGDGAATWYGCSGNGRAGAEGFELDGRAAMVAPGAMTAQLFDGRSVEAGGLRLETEPGWDGTLVNVVGDLNGDTRTSGLVVRFDRPVPDGRSLAGQVVTVRHNITPEQRNGYTIDNVVNLGDDRVLLSLRGAPPFVQNEVTLVGIDEDRRSVTMSAKLYKGMEAYTGRTVYLPKTRLRSKVAEILNYGRQLVRLKLADTLPPEVTVGDTMIIYTINPGDRVHVPSLAAVRPVGDDQPGTRLSVIGTGPVKLTVPRRFTGATLEMPAGRVPLEVHTGEDSTVIEIPAGRLDGTAGVLELD